MEQNDQEIIYSPSAIINLFNNAIVVPQTKKIIRLKGVYQQKNGNSYNGYYYDQLKDESTDFMLTLIVPALIRNEITTGKTLEIYGYITRKVSNYGRIEIQVTLSDLVSQTQNKYSDEEIKALELQQKKAVAGFRDVDGFIKSRIVNQNKIAIDILIGRTGIIDSDILHQLEETIAFYEINFVRVNLTSESEIINAVNDSANGGSDLIVIARGGGENQEVFDKCSLAEHFLNVEPLFVTAIGHAQNISLVQKMADKAFITPTAFGQYLNDLYNSTVEELQQSKAKLISDITQTLKANYDKQLTNLQEELKASKALSAEALVNANKNHQDTVNNINSKLKETEKLYLEKDNLLKKVNELLNTYKSDIETLKKQKEPSPGVPAWVIVVGIIVIIILIARACNAR